MDIINSVGATLVAHNRIEIVRGRDVRKTEDRSGRSPKARPKTQQRTTIDRRVGHDEVISAADDERYDEKSTR